MKKTTTKKLASSLIIAALVALVGAVLVTADTSEDTDETEEWPIPSEGFERMHGHGSQIYNELTDDQQAEVEELIESLNEEGASAEEIQDAVSQLLDDMGVLDERLDNAITHAEEQLEILNRQKELREEGYSWDEINDIIAEEYDLEFPLDMGIGIGLGGHGCHGGPGGPPGFTFEDTETPSEDLSTSGSESV